MFDELVDVVSRLWNSKTFLRPLRHENRKKLFSVSFAFFFKWAKDVVVFLKKEKNNRTQFYHFKSKQMFFSDQKTSEYYFRYTYSMYIVEQKTAD